MPPLMDRDYPMTRRQTQVLVGGLVAMVAVGFALFGGLIPGVHLAYASDIVSFGGVEYYSESSVLHVPLAVNAAPPWNVSFRNVTFELWLSSWFSPTGGLVHGVGTELNGSNASFTLGNTNPNGSRQTLFVSPDLEWGIFWPGGVFGPPFVQLLVRT